MTKNSDVTVSDAPVSGTPIPDAPIIICMGSQSDWPVMQHTAAMLDLLEVPYEARIISAHRTPDRLTEFAKTAHEHGVKVIIAGAGGSAHLPGMIAAHTIVPVLGVPVETPTLQGMDALLSIVQMPGGVPVGTLAIGKAGAKNAGLLAAQILALMDAALAKRLGTWRQTQTDSVPDHPSGE